VKVKPDGSLDFSTYDLALDTELETQRHSILTVVEAIKLPDFVGSGKLRCQSPFRDSDSFAAFLALGSDGKPFVYDSGTGTKHWLNDKDWVTLRQREGSDEQSASRETEQGDGADRFSYASFSDLKTNPPRPRPWLVQEWMPLCSVVALFSLGGLGKSLLAQQVATHIAAGIDVFGQKVIQGPVLGFMCEDDNAELRWRQQKINAALKLDDAPPGLFLEGRAGKDTTLYIFDAQSIPSPTKLLSRIDTECAEKNPVLVIVDNIAQVFAGQENFRHQVTSFCNALTGVAQQHNCCVLLLGHTAKAEGSEYSGSTGWEAAVRTRLWLKRLDNGLLELHRKKANYAGLDCVTLEWRDGYLHTVSGGGRTTVNAVTRAAVGQALAELTKAKITTSNSPQARNYLPKLMRDQSMLYGISIESAKAALADMIGDGTIIPRSDLGWRDSGRHAAEGLKLGVPQCASTPENEG
jgi:hypothetical protein